MNSFYKKVILITILIIGGIIFKGANAADPEFMVSWKPNTYTPSYYQGKSLPIEDSYIDVSFEMISKNANDFGKIIDISDKQVRWYINGDIVSRMDGRSKLRINNNMVSGSRIAVDIEVEYYNDKGNTYFPRKRIEIPVSNPKVYILNKSKNSSLLENKLSFLAEPMFFNVNKLSSLIINWSVNRNSVEDNSQGFNLDINLGGNIPYNKIDLGASVYNKDDGLEFAQGFKTFNLSDL